MRSRSPEMRIAATISRRSMRHRLAPGDGQDGLLLDLALQGVEPPSAAITGWARAHVAPDERVDGVDQHLLGDAAHLRDRRRRSCSSVS